MALSDVVTPHHDGKFMQSVPIWNVRVTLFCLGSIGALKNIHRSMRWQLFFHLFLDTNGDISVPRRPRRTAIHRVERRPHFHANSISLLQMTHSPGSFSSHNDGSHSGLHGSPRLCCFSAYYSDNMADIDPIYSGLQLHSFFLSFSMINLQPHICRLQCYSSRAHGTPMLLLPTTSTTPYFLHASDPSVNFFARPSCSILTSGRLPFVNHPRAFFSSGDYSTALFGRLQHDLTLGRLLSQHSHLL